MILHTTSRKLQTSEGFTFIEILIYLGIVGILAVSFITFSLAVSGSSQKTVQGSEVHSNMRMASQIIARNIRSASQIEIGQSTFDINPSVLVLNHDGVLISFSISPEGQLLITEGNNSPTPLTSSEVEVSQFIVSNLTHQGKRGHLRFSLEIRTRGDDTTFSYTRSITTAISLRR